MRAPADPGPFRNGSTTAGADTLCSMVRSQAMRQPYTIATLAAATLAAAAGVYVETIRYYRRPSSAC
jgi:hypothetical protein